MTKGDPTVAAFGDDRRAMTDAIKRVFEEGGYLNCSHQATIDRAD
jgi:hypothetical protein